MRTQWLWYIAFRVIKLPTTSMVRSLVLFIYVAYHLKRASSSLDINSCSGSSSVIFFVASRFEAGVGIYFYCATSRFLFGSAGTVSVVFFFLFGTFFNSLVSVIWALHETYHFAFLSSNTSLGLLDEERNVCNGEWKFFGTKIVARQWPLDTVHKNSTLSNPFLTQHIIK